MTIASYPKSSYSGLVGGQKYSSPSILRYIYICISYKTKIFKKIVVKSFLTGFWPFLHQNTVSWRFI
jgi:F0F1-type ATP synthase assembly protein I